ncbi:hypothetical protein GDO81_013368 [Engystomops pustulosus]|uniref:Uncharacterized protein n=1 Tax=Engystomops pustulosus TaxID=76066 RepID=A0AAV7AYY3_ENGPU|nr:hypothetical protein GDO81_013368 [Engystomops pustulosus]
MSPGDVSDGVCVRRERPEETGVDEKTLNNNSAIPQDAQMEESASQ